MPLKNVIFILIFIAVAASSAVAVATSCSTPFQGEKATLTLVEVEVDGEPVEPSTHAESLAGTHELEANSSGLQLVQRTEEDQFRFSFNRVESLPESSEVQDVE